MDAVKGHIHERIQAVGLHIQGPESKIIEQILFRLIKIRVEIYI